MPIKLRKITPPKAQPSSLEIVQQDGHLSLRQDKTFGTFSIYWKERLIALPSAKDARFLYQKYIRNPGLALEIIQTQRDSAKRLQQMLFDGINPMDPEPKPVYTKPKPKKLLTRNLKHGKKETRTAETGSVLREKRTLRLRGRTKRD